MFRPASIFALLCAVQGILVPAQSSFGGATVQLFEWSWADVADECENFLSAKGYKAVQISPPMEHIQGPEWWTRYQPVSYNLTSRSGTPDEFEDMVKRCDKAGVAIVTDAVINHMAAGSGTGTAGSSYGSRSYPMYSPNDFHHDDNNVYHNCEVDDYYDKDNVQSCDLVGLPDLMTGSDYVQSQIADYINTMISYGIKGIRVDAAKHQDADELGGIVSRLPADFYVGQEVIGADGEAVQPDMYYGNGQSTEFYYADYLDPNIISENKMTDLENFGEAWGLMPDKYAVSFLDNHDTQRNGNAQLTYKDGDLYTFANIFMLAWPYGNVRVMSSYYFTNTDAGPPGVGVDGGSNCMDGRNWVCEHRWGPIANMVAWRNAAQTAEVSNWQTGTGNQIAFSRNGAAFIALNRDPNSAWQPAGGSLQTGLPQGTYCNVLEAGDAYADQPSKCATTVTVNIDGTIDTLSVPALSAVGIHVNAKQ